MFGGGSVSGDIDVQAQAIFSVSSFTRASISSFGILKAGSDLRSPVVRALRVVETFAGQFGSTVRVWSKGEPARSDGTGRDDGNSPHDGCSVSAEVHLA